jgi:unsaturated rhamnogalacturonyl hydrolase
MRMKRFYCPNPLPIYLFYIVFFFSCSGEEIVPKDDGLNIGLIDIIYSDPVTSSDSVFILAKSVADWQLNHLKMSAGKYGWSTATFYNGLSACNKTIFYNTYMNRLVEYAKGNRWKISRIPQYYDADSQAIGKLYLDLYDYFHEYDMINDLIQLSDSMVDIINSDYNLWTWSDALFMAPPNFVRLYKLTNKNKYDSFMTEKYKKTVGLLYDSAYHLMYRDKRFICSSNLSADKIFWLRGNGWVLAGLAQILKEYDSSDDNYQFFRNLYLEMINSIIIYQNPEGYWTPNILNSKSFNFKESSGTALVCYALAYGINNNLLSKNDYLLPTINAWRSIVSCVSQDGRLGWVQEPGDAPAAVDKDNYQDYGSGAFLLAASEMYPLLKKISTGTSF